jgi:hypothetical protein
MKTLCEVRRACTERGFRVIGHYVDRYDNPRLCYTVVNFRGGVCFGGLNSRCDRAALIEWANKYMTYPIDHAI